MQWSMKCDHQQIPRLKTEPFYLADPSAVVKSLFISVLLWQLIFFTWPCVSCQNLAWKCVQYWTNNSEPGRMRGLTQLIYWHRQVVCLWWLTAHKRKNFLFHTLHTFAFYAFSLHIMPPSTSFFPLIICIKSRFWLPFTLSQNFAEMLLIFLRASSCVTSCWWLAEVAFWFSDFSMGIFPTCGERHYARWDWCKVTQCQIETNIRKFRKSQNSSLGVEVIFGGHLDIDWVCIGYLVIE